MLISTSSSTVPEESLPRNVRQIAETENSTWLLWEPPKAQLATICYYSVEDLQSYSGKFTADTDTIVGGLVPYTKTWVLITHWSRRSTTICEPIAAVFFQAKSGVGGKFAQSTVRAPSCEGSSQNRR